MKPRYRLFPTEDGGYRIESNLKGGNLWETEGYARNEDEGRQKIRNLQRPIIFVGDD